MKRLSASAGLIGAGFSQTALAADESRVALELLLVSATLVAMLVVTWRRRYIMLAKRRRRSGKYKRLGSR